MVNNKELEGEDKENTPKASSTGEFMSDSEMEEEDDDDETDKRDEDYDGVSTSEEETDDSTDEAGVPRRNKHLKSKPSSPGNTKPSSLTTNGTLGCGRSGSTDQNESLQLEVGENYLVQRNDNQWCKLEISNGRHVIPFKYEHFLKTL